MCGELLLSMDYNPTKAILFITLVMARDLALPQSGPESDHAGDVAKPELRPKSQSPQHVTTQGVEPEADSSGASKGAVVFPPREPPHVTLNRAEQSSSGLEGAEFDDVLVTVPSPFVLLHLIPNRK